MGREVSDQAEMASRLLIVVGVAVLALSILVIVWRLLDRRPPHWQGEQMAQLSAMRAATELFNDDFDAYPPFDANDPTGKPYCGAMKLAEALMGQDLMGCHSKSAFRLDGLDAAGAADLYPAVAKAEDLKTRRGPYLMPENANAFTLADVYGKGNTGPFPEDTYVLCDTFERKRPGGKKTGMPILYYRANRLGTAHRPGDPNNIYDYQDNHALLALGVPGEPKKAHPLMDPRRFYLNTQNVRATSSPQPFRAEEFILISAGFDGLYGTADDVCNFAWEYREE